MDPFKRDHALKTEAGRVEDQITALIVKLEAAQQDAERQHAPGHAEFYDSVLGVVRCAQGDLVQAYTSLLNGDDELGVMPLDQ